MTLNSQRHTELESLLSYHFPEVPRFRATSQREAIPSGIDSLDAVSGGILRGALTEITGPISSGRTSLLLWLLASLTSNQESCALVDANDMFHPQSAASVGVQLDRLLWVRCNGEMTRAKATARGKERGGRNQLNGALEQAFKTADLILQSKGFGMVALDLASFSAESIRRVPLTTWFRFRRVVEGTRTALLVLEREPHARTCASLVLQLNAARIEAEKFSAVGRPEVPSYATLWNGLECSVNILELRNPTKSSPDSSANSMTWRISTDWCWMPSNLIEVEMQSDPPIQPPNHSVSHYSPNPPKAG